MTNLLGDMVTKEIDDLIHKSLSDHIELSKEEVSEIISELIPDLDHLISKNIKKHLVEIAKFVIEKFDE